MKFEDFRQRCIAVSMDPTCKEKEKENDRRTKFCTVAHGDWVLCQETNCVQFYTANFIVNHILNELKTEVPKMIVANYENNGIVRQILHTINQRENKHEQLT